MWVAARWAPTSREAALARGIAPWLAGVTGGKAPVGETDADLVTRAGQGDAAAFRRLVDRHIGAALGIARRLLRDEAEAEDVVQEGMLRLWRMSSQLEIGESGVKPWLRRVVSNLCIDRLRAGSRTDVVEEPPEQAQPPDQLAALTGKDVSDRVDLALKELPERQRLALTLFHYDGMSQNEIAAVMSISDEAVESLLSRARRTLRALLRNDWRELVTDGGS